MSYTVPDELSKHTKHTLGIAHIASTEIQIAVAELQKKLVQELGDAIKLPKPQSLHITLVSVVQPKIYSKPSRKELFDEYKSILSERPKQIIGSFPASDIRFNKVSGDEKAIAILASNPSSFNNIRQKLTEKIPFPAETRQPPTVMHCTIARYQKQIEFVKVQKVINDLHIDFVERISQVHLFEDFDRNDPHKILATFDLKT